MSVIESVTYVCKYNNYSILENETGDLTGEIIYSYCGAKMVPPSEDIQLDDLC